MELGIQLVFLFFVLLLMLTINAWIIIELRRSYSERIKDKDKIISRLEIILQERDQTEQQLLGRITEVVQESTKMVRNMYTLIKTNNNP